MFPLISQLSFGAFPEHRDALKPHLDMAQQKTSPWNKAKNQNRLRSGHHEEIDDQEVEDQEDLALGNHILDDYWMMIWEIRIKKMIIGYLVGG